MKPARRRVGAARPGRFPGALAGFSLLLLPLVFVASGVFSLPASAYSGSYDNSVRPVCAAGSLAPTLRIENLGRQFVHDTDVGSFTWYFSGVGADPHTCMLAGENERLEHNSVRRAFYRFDGNIERPGTGTYAGWEPGPNTLLDYQGTFFAEDVPIRTGSGVLIRTADYRPDIGVGLVTGTDVRAARNEIVAVRYRIGTTWFDGNRFVPSEAALANTLVSSHPTVIEDSKMGMSTSHTEEFTLEVGPPPSPGNVAAASTQAGHEVSWSAPPDSNRTHDGFIVERAMSNTVTSSDALMEEDWTQVHEVADKEADSWVDTNIGSTGNYWYRVRAYTGEDDPSKFYVRVATRDDAVTPTDPIVVHPPPDPNGDGSVNASDALIFYYAYSLRSSLGTGR